MKRPRMVRVRLYTEAGFYRTTKAPSNCEFLFDLIIGRYFDRKPGTKATFVARARTTDDPRPPAHVIRSKREGH